MASIIPGYEYDIFISYRQKDNRYDGWVTVFVDNLKKELEATFKEEVNVYFDINPCDGLLETHDVDASLKEKLKCLVFSPIISQTYCDPKSFAWEHEFVAFNKLAKEDPFGRDVRLAGGNVSSRILPVKIHDLDQEDKTLHENEFGGALRSVDFIYKSSGVNRPLNPLDSPDKNLNKTYYRDQINKVANAVKDIITALKKYNQQDGKAPKGDIKEKPGKLKKLKSKYLLYIGVAAIIIFGFTYFNDIINIINQKNKFIRDESVITVISINKTRDSARIINPAMIEYLLKFNISNKCNLTLLNHSQFSKIYPPDRKEINMPQKNIIFKIINGEFLHEYEIEYKIIDNQNNSVFEDKITFRDRSDLLNLDGKLNKIISTLGTKIPKKNFLTNDWSAFENFYKGEIAWDVLSNIKARKFFSNSIKIDSTFMLPYLRLAKIDEFEKNNKSAKELINIVKASIGKLTIPDSIRAVALWHTLNGETKEAINNYKALIDYLPAQKEPYFELGEAYFFICDIKNASINYRKALAIDPDFALAHNHYAYCFSHSGQHDGALIHVRKYLKLEPTANAYDSYGDILFACGKLDSAKWAKNMGLRLDPNHFYIYTSLAYINVQEGKLKEAEKNIDTYISLQTEPIQINRGLTDKAFIYFAKNEFQKSLDTCRKAKSIFDSKDLLTRNHVLHWILSRIYLETNDLISFKSEMQDMNKIINKNNINEFNYNMIYKFYLDIEIHQFIKQMKIDEANDAIAIFDNEIHDKIKDWSYPFDIAFFNTEFGKLFLEIDSLNLAKKRFDKALEYNPKYPLAHFGLAIYYSNMGLNKESTKHQQEFNIIAKDADLDAKLLGLEQFARLVRTRN